MNNLKHKPLFLKSIQVITKEIYAKSKQLNKLFQIFMKCFKPRLSGSVILVSMIQLYRLDMILMRTTKKEPNERFAVGNKMSEKDIEGRMKEFTIVQNDMHEKINLMYELQETEAMKAAQLRKDIIAIIIDEPIHIHRHNCIKLATGRIFS